MKKLIIFIAMLLCSGQVVAATALRNGLYLNGKVGAARTQVKGDNVSAKKKGIPFALALGARIYHFRVEAEYAFMPKVKAKDFEVQSDTALAQVYYDFPLKSRIRPFLNVGAGRHSTKVKQVGKVSKTQHGIAYNLGGGLSFSISRASNFDLGYRYVRFREIKSQIGKIEPESHMVYIGWRYVF